MYLINLRNAIDAFGITINDKQSIESLYAYAPVYRFSYADRDYVLKRTGVRSDKNAIALAQDPVTMARAMGLAGEAGRLAYLAGRIPVKQYTIASLPFTGTVS